MNRRGFLFIIDALLAGILIVGGLVVLSSMHKYDSDTTQLSAVGNDALQSIDTIRVTDIDSSWLRNRINETNSSIPDANITALEQIGRYWSSGDLESARTLSEILLNSTSESYKLRLTINNTVVYGNDSWDGDDVLTSSRMVTGIAKGEATTGFAASAYLKRLQNKSNVLMMPFGGFIGQGNITLQLGPVPSDVSAGNITSVIVQIDSVEDFNLSINGVFCQQLISDRTLMTVQSWDVSACKGNLTPGYNNITFSTKADVANAYVAGGFVKVNYLTTKFQELATNSTSLRYRFPTIDGIINIYDSLYIPGFTNDWYLNVSFYSNYTVFMRMGNQTVFSRPGSNGTQKIILEAHNLSWSPQTLPLRMGTTNFTNITLVTAGQPADTVIVTDVSGSMGDCVSSYTSTFCTYDCCFWTGRRWRCNGGSPTCTYTGTCAATECGACGVGYSARNHDVYTDTICNQTKMDIAKSADKTAVSIILNASGNRVGLVSYSSAVQQSMALTSDIASLNTQIDGYSASGSTCICCGINRARTLLNNSPYKQFLIVMSDGDANVACVTSDALADTITAGQAACNNNITVFTIGFGSSMSAQGRSTLQQTACNASLYYDASNVSQLEQIYRNISQQILLVANFTAQTITINGTYVASHLYSGTVDFNYTALSDAPAQNEILVTFESPQFSNCTTEFDVPSWLRLDDVGITSYSGPYWTSAVTVDGATVFNLSEYSTDFVTVGDPFLVGIPVEFFNASNNTIRLFVPNTTANVSNLTNTTPLTACSPNNSIFFSGYINNSIPRSTVLSKAAGCNWSLEFEDGHYLNVTIPSSYSGNKTCLYTSVGHNETGFDPQDAYDNAVFLLMRQLDIDDDGRIFVNINNEDLEIVVTTISRVPYLWGPTLVTLEVLR